MSFIFFQPLIGGKGRWVDGRVGVYAKSCHFGHKHPINVKKLTRIIIYSATGLVPPDDDSHAHAL